MATQLLTLLCTHGAVVTPMYGAKVPMVRDHISRSLLSLDVEDTLNIAAGLLKGAQITGAPILEDNSLVGILSRNDLLRQLAGIDAAPDSEAFDDVLSKIQCSPVWRVMAKTPKTISPDETLFEAARIMCDQKLNRLMVQAKYSSVLGIISSTDVVFAMLGIDGELEDDHLAKVDCTKYECSVGGSYDDSTASVREHMATSLIVTSPEMSLGEAALLLKAARVTGAPVLDGDKLVGVLSRNDLLRALAEISPGRDYEGQIEELKSRQVGSVMSTGVSTISTDSTMLEAAQIMAEKRLNRLLVSSGPDTLCGIVSSTDVVFAMLCGDDDALDEDLVDLRFNEDRQGHASSAY